MLQREFKQKHAAAERPRHRQPTRLDAQAVGRRRSRARPSQRVVCVWPVTTGRSDQLSPRGKSLRPSCRWGVGNAERITEALDAYRIAAIVADDSVAEYEVHLPMYPNNASNTESIIDSLVALKYMALADHDFLLAQSKSGQERADLMASAIKNYRLTADQNYRILLRYYMDDAMAAKILPPGMNRTTIQNIPADQLGRIYAAAHQEIAKIQYDSYAEDRQEYEAYIRPC